MKYTKENKVMQALTRQVLRLVEAQFGKPRRVAYKTSPRDVVSDLDTAVDRLMVREIGKQFPHDVLVTEESSPELFQKILKGARGWVVDPLCGSSNVARGIRWFATNIVLVENGGVVAAWVVDHSQKRVIWGTGGRKIFADGMSIPHLSANKPVNRVDLDMGYGYLLSKNVQKRYADMIRDAMLTKDISVCRLGSSLGFAYVATEQIEGATTVNVYPWDLLAAAFLIEQSGGFAMNFDGTRWRLDSKSLIFAGNIKTHDILLQLIHKHKLSGIR